MHHVAFLYPNRHELVRTVRRSASATPSTTRRGATLAVYLDDPDRNGVEVYYDRPPETWFDAHGRPVLRNDRIEVYDVITEPARA